LSQEIENISALSFERGRDGQQAGNKLTAPLRLSPKAGFAPNHRWPQSSFGSIISGFDPHRGNKSPQGRFDCQVTITLARDDNYLSDVRG